MNNYLPSEELIKSMHMTIEHEPLDNFKDELRGYPFMLGKNHTLETRQLMCDVHQKYWLGKHHTDSTKVKMKLSSNKMHCPKHAEKMRIERVGEGNPFYGQTHEGDLSRFGHQKRCKAITIDGVKYPSSRAAADALNKSPALISRWLKQGKAVLDVL